MFEVILLVLFVGLIVPGGYRTLAGLLSGLMKTSGGIILLAFLIFLVVMFQQAGVSATQTNPFSR